MPSDSEEESSLDGEATVHARAGSTWMSFWSARKPFEAGGAFYSRAYLRETVPVVLFILARHGTDPETAIVRAVNDTKDNDTVAAIVGAAVGAMHGEDALPRRWRDGLLGRTSSDDDGRMFELLDRAQAVFGPPWRDRGMARTSQKESTTPPQ